MGGCFSGQKGLESENAPVQLPVEPTENVVETPKEAPLVDVSETKDVVPKEAEVVAEHVADKNGLEAVSNVKEEEAKDAEVETSHSGTEGKTSDVIAAV